MAGLSRVIEDGRLYTQASGDALVYRVLFDWAHAPLRQVVRASWVVVNRWLDEPRIVVDSESIGFDLQSIAARFSGGVVGQVAEVEALVETNENPKQTLTRSFTILIED